MGKYTFHELGLFHGDNDRKVVIIGSHRFCFDGSELRAKQVVSIVEASGVAWATWDANCLACVYSERQSMSHAGTMESAKVVCPT